MSIFAFDHNVIVSAVLFRDSTPFRLVEDALSNHIAVTTTEILLELQEVLSRVKFDRYIPLPRRMDYLDSYTSRCRVLTSDTIIIECRDPDDDKCLALAVDSGADYLISGDIHLLEMNPWRGIPILKPLEFFALHATKDLP